MLETVFTAIVRPESVEKQRSHGEDTNLLTFLPQWDATFFH